MRARPLRAVPNRPTPPETEEEVLGWWNANDTFKESVRLSEGRPRWSFYDGPPFATGLPHYGHILAGTIKVLRAPAAARTTDMQHTMRRPNVLRRLRLSASWRDMAIRGLSNGLASICLLSIQRPQRAP